MINRSSIRSIFAALTHCVVLLGVMFLQPVLAADRDIPLPDCRTGEPVEIDSSVTIGEVTIDNQNVFDLEDPKENNFIFRTANKLHVPTREYVIRQRMLVQPGDPFSLRLVRETERLARAPDYIYDDYVCVWKLEDGRVDLNLVTRDVWTLRPGFSLGRSGGANSGSVIVEEGNLFGTGIAVSAGYASNVDRDTTLFTVSDQNILNTWIAGDLLVANSSDGSTLGLSLAQPFYSLDSKNAWQLQYLDDERTEFIYDRGDVVDEFERDQSYRRAAYGWSKGLKDDWTRRFSAGVVRDFKEFSPVDGSDQSTLIPEDREFQYPFVGFELQQDRFVMVRNRDQIGRTEDFYLGTGVSATLGFLHESLGSDRNGLILQSGWTHGLTSNDETHWLADGNLSGRWESGEGFVNTLVGAGLRYYHQQSANRLLYVSLRGTLGQDLDLDNLLELGGDSGLRGYPLRYQTGDKRALLTVEQRFFTSWYPFRLFYVGAAAFFDAGRTWGNNPLGAQNLGLLKDVGIGLRLAGSRSSEGSMIHIDFAMPLDGDSGISSYQINITAKQGF